MITAPLLEVTPKAPGDGSHPAVSDGNTPTPRARGEQTLRLLAGFGALTRAQLEPLLFGDAPLASASRRVLTFRTLGDFRERGLIETANLPGDPRNGIRAYVLTSAGRRLYARSDPDYPRPRIRRSIGTVLLAHAVALAEIALLVRHAVITAGDVTMRWETDWQCVARLGTTAIPDALLTLEQGGWRIRAFIEADRATERDAAFAMKIRRYLALHESERWRSVLASWPLILTVTASQRRATQLVHLSSRVTAAAGASTIARAFHFAAVDEVRAVGALHSCWRVPGEPGRVAIFDLAPSSRSSPVVGSST